MRDLNDMYYFVQAAKHGGFAAAARVLGEPKSKLSRHVAHLEKRVGVRLIQRSTRQFSLTAMGDEYLRHCTAMLVEADAADEVIDRARAEPCGVVKLSCPPALLHARVAGMLVRFMSDFPLVRVALDATNREADVINDGLDLALRVRFPPIENSDLVARTLAHDPWRIVASPALQAKLRRIRVPADLPRLPIIDAGRSSGHQTWVLEGPKGEHAQVAYEPRLTTDDMITLREAVLSGTGVGMLPDLVVHDDIAEGRLQVILPEWRVRVGIIQAVFPSRRGLIPAVRSLLEFLASEFQRISPTSSGKGSATGAR